MIPPSAPAQGPLVLALVVDGPLTPEAQARALHAHTAALHALAHGGAVGRSEAPGAGHKRGSRKSATFVRVAVWFSA